VRIEGDFEPALELDGSDCFASGEIGDLAQCLLLEEPFAIAALFPVGKVGFVDGAALEIALEDGLGFREGIEPVDELAAGFAVVEAAVEEGAKFARDDGRSTAQFLGEESLSVTFCCLTPIFSRYRAAAESWRSWREF